MQDVPPRFIFSSRYLIPATAGRFACFDACVEELSGAIEVVSVGGFYHFANVTCWPIASFYCEPRPSFLFLSDGCAIRSVTARSDILDLDGDDIAAAIAGKPARHFAKLAAL